MNGFYLADGERLVDNHTTIDHLMQCGKSRQILQRNTRGSS